MRILSILLLFVLSLRVYAADWYVDSGVVTSGNGTSWANAWKDTTNIVWGSVGPGDTVWIRQGSYSRLFIKDENGISVKIDPAATGPAIFQDISDSRIYNCNDLVIDGLVGSNRFFHIPGLPTAYPPLENGFHSVFSIGKCQRVTVRGLYINREPFKAQEQPIINGFAVPSEKVVGISINNAAAPNNEIIVDNCEVRYTTSDGVNITPTSVFAPGWDRYIIRNSLIFNYVDDGIQFGGSGVTVESCVIDKNFQRPSEYSHQDGIQASPYSSFSRARNNIVKNGNVIGIFYQNHLGPAEVYQNIVIGREVKQLPRGFSLFPSTSTSIPYNGGNWVVANNVVIDCWSYLAYLGGGATRRIVPPDKLFVGNNIYLNCKQVYGSSNNFGSDFDNSSELWWDGLVSGEFNYGGNPLDLMPIPGTQPVQYFDLNNGVVTKVNAPNDRAAFNAEKADPRFVNPTNVNATALDFALQEGSPAIGKGINFSQFFTTDFFGSPRPLSGPWDRGAIVYNSGTAPPDTTPPVLQSQSINVTGNTLSLTFNEFVQGINPAHYTISGYTLSNLQGSGSNWTFTISPIVQAGPTLSMTYASGAGRTRDLAGNLLASGTFSVTNGSLEQSPDPPKPGRKGTNAKRFIRR